MQGACLVRPPPSPGSVPLVGCLHRFTRRETLGDRSCPSCKAVGMTQKQLTVRQLPPVLCLHLKRFEVVAQAGSKAQVTARKLSTHVAFPVSHLDMTPFLTHTAVRQRCRVQRHPGGESRGMPGSAGSTPESRGLSPVYELYGVVVHCASNGKTLESGHYVNFIRCGHHWFQCNDARIALADERSVRNSEAYMLFYRQKPTNPMQGQSLLEH